MIKIMGCCFSSCKDSEDSQGPESSQRPLLQDPVVNATQVVNVPVSEANKSPGLADGGAGRGQEDELQKILQETASAMIDVSGAGAHSLDQRECQERSRHYLTMIQSLSPSLLKPPTSLLSDFPNPEKQLGASLISQEDLDLMEWAMTEIEDALQNIRIDSDEDLVVPFGQQSFLNSSSQS